MLRCTAQEGFDLLSADPDTVGEGGCDKEGGAPSRIGFPLTVGPHLHRYREVHSANKRAWKADSFPGPPVKHLAP